MDLSYSTTNLFPVPIHIFDVNGFNQIKNQLIDYAYDLKKKDSEGVTISNRGGWQSSGFNIDDKDDILQSFLMNCLDGFSNIKNSVNFKIYAWVNINKNGGYNIKHNHPTSDLSGVLWIKCSDNCGNIEFDNPSVFQTFREINSYTDDFYKTNEIKTKLKKFKSIELGHIFLFGTKYSKSFEFLLEYIGSKPQLVKKSKIKLEKEKQL